PRTTVAKEYSLAHIANITEPYYPIPQDYSRIIYDKYKTEMSKLEGKVYFIGRLADYKYYNMDQIVGVALQLFERKIGTA
ncbi:MAG: UDP-galactopyranose mutase, partial [Bacteroidota bacterium]|nr:UDP-galactopyranose mutase [Bacteroidota bacterium]